LPALTQALPTPAIARDAAGRLLIFAADANNALWSTMQSLESEGHGVSASRWGAWQRIDTVMTDGGLAALGDANGAIELYLRDKPTGHMLRITQIPPGPVQQAWNAPIDLGFAYTGQPAVGLDEHGSVAVAALERAGGSVWLVEGGQPALKLPGELASSPSLRTVDGALHIAARGNAAHQGYWIMTRVNGVWTAPQSIGALPTSGGGAFQ
jgi:hypothetical protein